MKKSKILLSGALALMVAGCASWFPAETTGSEPVKPNYDKAYEDYIQLGAYYINMGRYDLAEPKLKRAIEINSKPPEAWNMLAVLYEEQKDIQSANMIYTRLLASHPDYVLGYYNYGTFLCTFNRDGERLDLYEKMRSKGTELTTLSYISDGDCQKKRNNLANAKTAYENALTYDSQAPGALLPLADIANQQQRYNDALNYLNVVHTYVGYTNESVRLTLTAAKGTGDQKLENQMMQMLNKKASEPKSAGI